MYHQYRDTRVPTSLFEQTQYEADQLFYATFPAARDAARNGEMYMTSTQEQSYQQLDFAYSEVHHQLHPQQAFLSHHQIQPSYYSPPRPIETQALVYSPPNHPYHNQYSSEPASQYIPQSHPIPVPDREPTYLYHPSNISPHVTTDFRETVGDGRPETPRYNFRQLNRQMNPPTLNFSNNSQLGVMRLDRLSDRSDLDFPQLSDQSLQSPLASEASETSPVTPCPSTPPPTEFLLNSAPSPSIGLSSLPPSKDNTPEKKPLLACLFCRGRKIACGVPLPGTKKTCSQCWKRGLTCYYPTESRRGMRKKKPPGEGDADVAPKTKKKKKN